MAGQEIGGEEHTGWVDIGFGMNAFQRSTKEYIVLVEDDYVAKVIMYRWAPEGIGPEKPVVAVDARSVVVKALPGPAPRSFAGARYDLQGRAIPHEPGAGAGKIAQFRGIAVIKDQTGKWAAGMNF